MKNEDVTKGNKWFGAYTVEKFEISIWGYSKNEHSDESMEFFFLHYHSEKEAKEKWARRIKCINWDRLLVKFNDQNGCTRNR